MFKITLFAFSLALSLALSPGCSKREPAQHPPATSEGAGAPAQAAAAQHAPAGYEPGSHEDWCGEHAVPESQCTRCNPELIAAFKATGDWCGEHGLPESQCLACNPDLTIVRPPPAGQK